MKIFDDILSSVSGNARTKINDPFAGTFIVSWVLCNWSQLAVLIWGEGSVSTRVENFHSYLKDGNIFEINTLASIPLVFTLFYLFIFPWLSLFVKYLQKSVNEKLHKQAIEIDLENISQQEQLNKAKLKSDPDKHFLEDSVQLEIDRRKEILEKIKERGVLLKARTQEAIARAAEAESKLNTAKIEEEKRVKQAELDRERFNSASLELKSAQASNRFPSAYAFMLTIDESLRERKIKISLLGLSEILAAIFGYKNFQTLINDERFNNKTISNVKYFIYNPESLAEQFENIISDEEDDFDELTSELIFEHVSEVLDNLSYKFVTMSDLEAICLERFEEHKYEILNGPGASGAIAESDTIFDEIEANDLGQTILSSSDGFSAVVNATATGQHRKDNDIPGRDIAIAATLKCQVQLGRNALAEFEIDKVSAHVIDYFGHEPS
ncbi:hypothetical protein [Pseudomonas nitroreducens]|uniref:hypothetical protein n=1 Tax=Pseudomonas nitroreducens TaxID=46680 RepID=UPI003CC8270B